jgi:hypothetical protein
MKETHGRYTIPHPFPITDMKENKVIEITEEGRREFEELK